MDENLETVQADYEKLLAKLFDREKREKIIDGVIEEVKERLSKHEGDFHFDEIEEAILKLKLARHLERAQQVDVNILFDAIIESPGFISDTQGSLIRLFEVHEQKTLQKIAEIRKKKAEQTGDLDENPYEKLLVTESGNYYIARLLNMPHLIEESEYMKHCLGLSDSYVNRMKRGEIEIFSFRESERDIPIATIEYNLKTKIITQLRKEHNESLIFDDPFLGDLVNALKKLRQTTTDAGELRDFKRVNLNELWYLTLDDYHLVTEKGIISLSEYEPSKDDYILKIGKMDITPEMSVIDIVKILKIILDIDCKPEEFAKDETQISPKTKVYLGPLFPGIFQNYHLEHILTLSLREVRFLIIKIGGKSGSELESELRAKEIKISDYTEGVLLGSKFSTLKNSEEINLVRLRVENFGFANGATTVEVYEQAKKIGLIHCPPEVGPYLRLQDLDQPLDESYYVALNRETDSTGIPGMFIEHNREGLTLTCHVADPEGHWSAESEFVFCRT